MALTLQSLEHQIEADLDWRQAELAIFRELLSQERLSAVRQAALFRAAWALLYAHYEGFCKNSLQLLADFISGLPHCKTLPKTTFMYMHDKKLRLAKSLSTAEAYKFYRGGVDKLRKQPPPSITIDTESNLWPNLLSDLLEFMDISSSIIDQPDKMRVLVARRNDIAHGQKVFIQDLPYYLEYEEAVFNLMYALALAVGERAAAYHAGEAP